MAFKNYTGNLVHSRAGYFQVTTSGGFTYSSPVPSSPVQLTEGQAENLDNNINAVLALKLNNTLHDVNPLFDYSIDDDEGFLYFFQGY